MLLTLQTIMGQALGATYTTDNNGAGTLGATYTTDNNGDRL